MAKIMGNLVGPPNPRPVVDTEFDWISESENPISHKAVAQVMSDQDMNFYAMVDSLSMDVSVLSSLVAYTPDVYEYGDEAEADVFLSDNTIESYGVISDSLVASKYENENLYVGFTSVLYFATPSVLPNNYSDFPDDIYFKGDSTDNGAFIPEANMRYTIVFDFDGYMMNGYVSGVTMV